MIAPMMISAAIPPMINGRRDDFCGGCAAAGVGVTFMVGGGVVGGGGVSAVALLSSLGVVACSPVFVFEPTNTSSGSLSSKLVCGGEGLVCATLNAFSSAST